MSMDCTKGLADCTRALIFLQFSPILTRAKLGASASVVTKYRACITIQIAT